MFFLVIIGHRRQALAAIPFIAERNACGGVKLLHFQMIK